ncbi:transcription factor GLABRA 3-like [Dorcoceras hygrometricum]|uniref:Transcription factor GLABRA 3-like n=1 Tax=Dorcoceras hygrometricum TaxID=472368 RepID=A0A2Z7AWC0_9LAMI|nr:transcription factor GLABRA 3-like [Dorcoceras hygrometricum]
MDWIRRTLGDSTIEVLFSCKIGLVEAAREVTKVEDIQARTVRRRPSWSSRGQLSWYSEGTPELVQQRTTRSQKTPKLVHQIGGRAGQVQIRARAAQSSGTSYARAGTVEDIQARTVRRRPSWSSRGQLSWYSEGTPELVQQRTTRSQKTPKLVHQIGGRAGQVQIRARAAQSSGTSSESNEQLRDQIIKSKEF